MINLYIYGNCQSQPLSRIIQRLTAGKLNVIHPETPVHLLTDADEPRFRKVIEYVDIFIYQHITSDKYEWRKSEKIIQTLNSDTKAISIPSLYFDAYFDSTISIDHPPMNSFIPYHNKLILDCYIKGLTINETLDKFINNTNVDVSKDRFKESLASLQRREETVDIKISDYIEKNFLNSRLFWTVNHPTNELLIEVAKRIIKYIFNSVEFPHIRFSKEFLGDTSLPLSNHYLSQTNNVVDNRISVKKNIIDFHSYIKHFYEVYDLNKDYLGQTDLIGK